MSKARTIALLLATIAGPAAAQTAPDWSGSASIYTYVVPDEPNFVQPTVAVDRDWLHFEVRFNYEDLDTASVWVGRAFSIGESVAFEITPMAAVVLGNTDGGALGYSGSLTWRRLDLFSETEYVFASGEEADDFLYTWSELGWSPLSWLRTGLAVQRTKVYGAGTDIQRGVFGAVMLGKWELSSYLFNPDDDPTFMFGVVFNY